MILLLNLRVILLLIFLLLLFVDLFVNDFVDFLIDLFIKKSINIYAPIVDFLIYIKYITVIS